MNANNIAWFDIPVLDLKRAVEFYSELLDLKIEIEKRKYQDIEIAVIPCAKKNGITGCLAKSKEIKPSKTGILIYLNTQGRLDEAIKIAKKYNCEIISDKTEINPWGFRAIIIDTEGNQIALHSF
ncbi:MAG: VOC family protein [Rickettsiales bacterium]|nr:VOC family protein [Rickettsiales bacterium]